MVLTSTCNGFDGKIESTHRAALVLEEPKTQYGWARLGIESINLHKRGWRSPPLPVLLILSIPMAWAARCVLSNRVQKAHPPTIRRVIQILPLSNIYITTAVTDRNHTVCQGHSKKAIKQESVQAWWQVASRGHFPLLFVPPAHSNNCVCRASNTLPATCSLGSCRISLVLSRLLTFITRVMAASRCLPPASLAHTAPRLRRAIF